MDSTVETIIVDNNGCNDRSFTVLNLTRFVNLRVFEVGDYSFSYVNEVHMIGLPELERVMIGENCFSQCKDVFYANLSGDFYVKDCDKLRELRIGSWSFMDYSVCEIDNVDSLEVIEMGRLNDRSSFFHYASLELKSCSNETK